MIKISKIKNQKSKILLGFTPSPEYNECKPVDEWSEETRSRMTQCHSRHDVRVVTGFTLIEVIIALALLMATIIIFSSVLSSIPLTKAARNQNLAYHIAAKKIEELRNTPFNSLPSSGSFSDPALNKLENASGALTVADYEGASDIKKVTVTVVWTDPVGPAKSVALETLMSKNGLNKQ